jgi:Na+/melibiose symporter-like transporter
MNVDFIDLWVMPLFFGALFAVLSGGFMLFVQGNTPRTTRIWLCALLLEVGLFYCMAWHTRLASALGWKYAWIIVAVLIAISSVALCGVLLRRLAGRSEQVQGGHR